MTKMIVAIHALAVTCFCRVAMRCKYMVSRCFFVLDRIRTKGETRSQKRSYDNFPGVSRSTSRSTFFAQSAELPDDPDSDAPRRSQSDPRTSRGIRQARCERTRARAWTEDRIHARRVLAARDGFLAPGTFVDRCGSRGSSRDTSSSGRFFGLPPLRLERQRLERPMPSMSRCAGGGK